MFTTLEASARSTAGGDTGPALALSRSRLVDRAPAPQVSPQLPEMSADAMRAAELRAGLLKRSATIDPKFLYDTQGCVLFNAICELDEYYPTRTERAIFEMYRTDIASHVPKAAQWIDLGCGDCAKSRTWLEHVDASRFIGVDIAAEWIEQSVAAVGRRFPDIECVAQGADFTRGFDMHALLGDVEARPPLFFYPGSSIGNFAPDSAVTMLESVRSHLGSRGGLLVCVDLRKDPAIMKRAYADGLGVTAAFNKNVLRVANKLLGSDFRTENFSHQARFDEVRGCIEMRLVANSKQFVRLGGEIRTFEEGEPIVTEHSYKYTPEQFVTVLQRAGFTRHKMWTDPQSWFGVFLASA
jgi:dimethylhistidine N-methyltransferase